MGLLSFPRPTRSLSLNSAASSSLLARPLPPPPPLHDRMCKAIDRFQVLLIKRPETAMFLLAFCERFYDQNDV